MSGNSGFHFESGRQEQADAQDASFERMAAEARQGGAPAPNPAGVRVKGVNVDDPSQCPRLDWIECRVKLPENGVLVDTKLDDTEGLRNHQTLKRQGRLWFLPDGSMYVYYTPTHWRSTDA